MSNQAQIRSNSLSGGFIPEGGFITIFGHHNFMEGSGFIKPGVIKTFRSSDPGYIAYSKHSTWAGASYDQYIDGYVKSYHSGSFTFPVGHKTYYRPIKIHSSEQALVAYYRDNPKSVSDVLNQDVRDIASEEYWNVTLGVSSKITFTWDQSSEINLENLSIIGLNKESVWEVVPSVIDETVLNSSHFDGSHHPIHKSSIENGAITTASTIDPDSYDYFTLGYVNEKVKQSSFTASVFPNPQFVGSNIIVELEDFTGSSIEVNVHTAHNGVLYSETIETFPLMTHLELQYHFRESGPYIITLISDKTAIHKNIVVVDP